MEVEFIVKPVFWLRTKTLYSPNFFVWVSFDLFQSSFWSKGHFFVTDTLKEVCHLFTCGIWIMVLLASSSSRRLVMDLRKSKAVGIPFMLWRCRCVWLSKFGKQRIVEIRKHFCFDQWVFRVDSRVLYVWAGKTLPVLCELLTLFAIYSLAGKVRRPVSPLQVDFNSNAVASDYKVWFWYYEPRGKSHKTGSFL